MHILPLTAKEVEERLLKLDTLNAGAALFEAEHDAANHLVRVDVDYTIKSGAEVKFRSPVDCSEITGLVVYYPNETKEVVYQEFAFADAKGNNVGDIEHLFAENVVVKVILDVDTSMAFVQNAVTNAYLEEKLSQIASDVAYVDDKVEDPTIAPQNVDTLGGIPAADYATKNFVTDNMEVFAAEESISTSCEIINADTLQGYNASSFRKSDWLPTVAEIGAATAGLVSGGFIVTELGQIGSTLLNYYSSMSDLTMKNVYIDVETNGLELGGGRWMATIYRQHGSLAVVKALDLINGYERQTTITNGVVGEWEWVNPPMLLGVEYRTTERWNGKPVYVKMIDFGVLPSNTYKDITAFDFSPITVGIEGFIKYTGENTYAHLTGVSFVDSVQVMYNRVRITTNTESATNWYATVVVYYTKS